jgi:hypothetical protein
MNYLPTLVLAVLPPPGLTAPSGRSQHVEGS